MSELKQKCFAVKCVIDDFLIGPPEYHLKNYNKCIIELVSLQKTLEVINNIIGTDTPFMPGFVYRSPENFVKRCKRRKNLKK